VCIRRRKVVIRKESIPEFKFHVSEKREQVQRVGLKEGNERDFGGVTFRKANKAPRRMESSNNQGKKEGRLHDNAINPQRDGRTGSC